MEKEKNFKSPVKLLFSFSYSFHTGYPYRQTMLILYETAAGYALFKLVNDSKLEKSDDLWKDFETAEKANAAYVSDLHNSLLPQAMIVIPNLIPLPLPCIVSNSRPSQSLKTPLMLCPPSLVSSKARSPRT